MKLTPEQELIANSIGNLKINAVAGSGKTTTIVEYAHRREKDARILYLAFNKSVRIEADKKFLERGLTNVTVETAHSLAYKHIVRQNNYVVKHNYKTEEVVEALDITSAQKHAEYVLANHVLKFVSYFCNSNKKKVEELDYREVVFDPKAKVFVDTYYEKIAEGTRLFLAKMNRGEIGVTHDFYLKKFQLQNPILHYDYILFDEGQDASPAILDVFLRQNSTKIIVGDTHQQIYAWRYAINSLEQVDFPVLNLSTSFRFGKDIATLAKAVLNWKNHIQSIDEIIITGANTDKKQFKPKTTLARTNLGLLYKAISYVGDNGYSKKVYFEGNINTYTYADEGTSLYDVLNLYNGKKQFIRSKLIKSMNSLSELGDYVEKTEDVQLAMMIDLVKQYGDEIYNIINSLKELHVQDGDKDKADMVFSTVHKSKGMEYDSVQLANDFLSEMQIKKMLSEINLGTSKYNKAIEEINLLYVAITRAKNSVYIQENIAPEGLPKSPHITLIKEEPKQEYKYDSVPQHRGKAYSGNYNQKNSVPKLSEFERQNENITNLFLMGFSAHEIALDQKMSYGDVMDRMNILGLKGKQKK